MDSYDFIFTFNSVDISTETAETMAGQTASTFAGIKPVTWHCLGAVVSFIVTGLQFKKKKKKRKEKKCQFQLRMSLWHAIKIDSFYYILTLDYTSL